MNPIGQSLEVEHGIGDWLNYVVTNRLPRRSANRLMKKLSTVEHPLIAKPALWLWQTFSDLDLSDSATTEFTSVHHCFTRELRDGARSVDQDPTALVSPTDGYIVSAGKVTKGELLQVKGSTYELTELLCNPELAERFEGGNYLTVRITSTMYHRMHAPAEIRPQQVDYIPGDSFNVNPQTLSYLDRVYCKNERAVIHCQARFGTFETDFLMVPVAAILVGGIVLRCLRPSGDTVLSDWANTERQGWHSPLNLKHTTELGNIHCGDTPQFSKGEELGRFEHGSTIILLLPAASETQLTISAGDRIAMGQRLATVTQNNHLTQL